MQGGSSLYWALDIAGHSIVLGTWIGKLYNRFPKMSLPDNFIKEKKKMKEFFTMCI